MQFNDSPLVFIGDVHGQFDELVSKLEPGNNYVQVGDLGLGFKSEGSIKLVNSNIGRLVPGISFSFIRGNHDDPKLSQRHPNYMGDWGDVETPGGEFLFYVSGAQSIDRAERIEGFDWWPDEELSYKALNDMLESYCFLKPEIMVTHDIPTVVSRELFPNKYIRPVGSITQQALDAAYEAHKPRLWIFGHYHSSVDKLVSETRFIGLAEHEQFRL